MPKQPIEPPDTHFLSAAEGWLDLGNLAEAQAELARVSPANRAHPDVLEMQWLICERAQDWAQGLQTAEALMQCAPDRASAWLHRAYSIRRIPSGSVQSAWDALFPAAEKFPKEPVVYYNLSCYAAQMGQLEEAWQLLQKATQVGNPKIIRHMALEDSDLAPLWERIKSGL